jgi:hypothetical protein
MDSVIPVASTVPAITRLLVVAAIVASIAGCAARPEDQPGYLGSGSVETVTRRSEAGVGASGDLPVADMALVKLQDQRPPTVPLLYGPSVRHAWVKPQVSANGRVYVEGYFVHLKVRDSQWAYERAVNEDRLRLAQLQNLRLDGDGRLVVVRPNPADPAVVDRLRGLSQGFSRSGLPWTGSTQQDVRRVTVINQDGTGATSTMVPAAGGWNPASAQDLQRSWQAAAAAGMQAQAGMGAPSPTPLPSAPASGR